MKTLDRTLARLSFEVPSERMAEFESAYQAKLVPILKTHGLTASSERGRPTSARIFSRLFEVKTPAGVAEKRETLQKDPAWQEALRELGEDPGAGALPFHFDLYSTPAGPGKTVVAGPGRQIPVGKGQGHWRTYDATDGLGGGAVFSILQDEKGYLWFATSSGVSR